MKVIHLVALGGAFWVLIMNSGCRQRSASASIKDAHQTVVYRELSADAEKIELGTDILIKVPAKSGKGFNFPYYVFLPATMDLSAANQLYVEPNNTGDVSDDLKVHDQAALQLVDGYPNQIARKLNTAVLIPVFPRPKSQDKIYTHYLDRDTLLVQEGPLKRIDLQLIAMVKDARTILSHSGMSTADKIFMHGYSASSGFSLRFAALHPEMVKAVAAGGVNCLPILPVTEWQGTPLRFAIGIADVAELSGSPFNKESYRKVAQYIYMGHLDTNDTVPFRDAWDENDAVVINNVLGEHMFPDRCDKVQQIFTHEGIPAQFVTYENIGHEIRPETIDDVVSFFAANRGENFVKIEPHTIPPPAPNQAIKTAHIRELLWWGDARIPAWVPANTGIDFVISISDWDAHDDYHQLTAFVQKAGFNFKLTAVGREPIVLSNINLDRKFSDGSGTFQAFAVRLKAEQLASMAPGVEYALEPVGNGSAYNWAVEPGQAVIKRPSP